MVTPIFRLNGEFFGVITQNGILIDTDGECLGKLIENEVWCVDGEYLGEVVDENYILRQKNVFKLPERQMAQSLSYEHPGNYADRASRPEKEGWVDALDIYP